MGVVRFGGIGWLAMKIWTINFLLLATQEVQQHVLRLWSTQVAGRYGATAEKLNHDMNWVVVSNIFYFHPYLGKIPMLTNILQMGWNHQLVNHEILMISSY